MMTNLPRRPQTTAEPIPMPAWHHNLRFLAAVTIFLGIMTVLVIALIKPWLALTYYYLARRAPAGFEKVFTSGEYPNLAVLAFTLLLAAATIALFWLLFKVLGWLVHRLRPIGLLRWLVWIAGIVMLVVFIGYLVRETIGWLMMPY